MTYQGAEYQLTTYYLAVTLGLLAVACSVNLALLIHSSRGRIWVEASARDIARLSLV